MAVRSAAIWPAVIQLGAADQGVVLRDPFLEGRQGAEFGDRVQGARFFRRHHGGPFTHGWSAGATWRDSNRSAWGRTVRSEGLSN